MPGRWHARGRTDLAFLQGAACKHLLVAPWLAHLGVHRPRPSSYMGLAGFSLLWLLLSSPPACVSFRLWLSQLSCFRVANWTFTFLKHSHFPTKLCYWQCARAAGHCGATRAAGRVVTRAGRAGGRVPRMPHAPPQVLPHLTLGGRLSLHPDRTNYCGAECGASVLVVNLSASRRCLWSAIDGSRTTARDRRRDGLGTFACAAALDRSAASAAPACAR